MVNRLPVQHCEKPSSLQGQKGRGIRGFTLVETLVVVAVATTLFLVAQALLSRSVRSTMKGQDNLETIRAASILFSEIKRDLLACSGIKVAPGASCYLAVGNLTLPPIPVGAEELSLVSRAATITYTLEAAPGGKKLVRRSEEVAGVTKHRDFGVPRMISFLAQEITKEQQVFAGGASPVKQVRIEIELDSQDKRFPSRSVRLSSFFISSQMSASNWNYVY